MRDMVCGGRVGCVPASFEERKFLLSRCVKAVRIRLAIFLSALALPALAPGVGLAFERAAPNERIVLAERYFRTAEHASPGSALRLRNYELAERIAEAVVEKEPDNATAYFLVFAARGKRLLAEHGRPTAWNFWKYSDLNAYLDRTIELDPNHADALAAKGGILLDLPGFLGGDRDMARRLLERAVKLNPTGPGTRITLARALLLEGNVDDARAHLLLAAHYACAKRELAPLKEAERMLKELDHGSL